mgnify:CR=1 FL=1
MSDKDKDAKTSSIAKTLNKVEDRLEKGENCSSVAEGLANVAKASELHQFRVDTSAQSVIAIPS